jgi:hypothetical protein
MKVTINKNGEYAVTGLTQDEYAVMYKILEIADSDCFTVRDKDGSYYSNENFCCGLTPEEREALKELVKGAK